MPMPPIVGLEIGTAKTVALVGEMREDNHVMITGMGERPASGVRKGEIVDLENAVVGLRTVLEMAEESGRVSIRQVYLAVSGGHIQGLVNRGVVPVLDEDGEITRDDMEQAMEVARAVNLPADREVLHTICQHYCIDEQTRVLRPEGMEGARLALDMLVLHGIRARLNNTVRVVLSIPLSVQDVAFSGLCSALSVLTPEQKKSGVVVIDLGAGTTDYLCYYDGIVAAAGALGVGGDHITNDVALAFTIPISQAERLKRDSGSAVIAAANPAQKVILPPAGGFSGRSVNLRALHTVINARAEEIFLMIKNRLEKAGVGHHVGAGMLLTGGGAHLKGIGELAEKVFGLPCTIGRPRHVSGLATATEGPEYAACSGLVQYGFRTNGRQHADSLIGRLKALLGR